MNLSGYLRFSLCVIFLTALLSPTAVLAMGDGKKYFKQGMKHEIAQEWDQAVEQFSLAVTEDPKNPEYKLHLRRAIFNASQMYVKKGTELAEQNDYAGAYNAFRRAYAFDSTNELAKAQMARMVRLIEDQDKTEGAENGTNGDGQVKLVRTSAPARNAVQDPIVPTKIQPLREVPFPSGVNLIYIVRQLAQELDLNVLFDAESRLEQRKVFIELKQVTASQALDYIFTQENLFFQKVGPRTIIVANGNRRLNFQQFVLRTFYLSNADPKEVQKVIQTAIPPQQGRGQTIALVDEPTNSITIRDTRENVRLISRLISSLDKDRAEVVMDVAIYEVSKSDLLRLGNQIGGETELTSLGGSTRGVVGVGGNDIYGGAATASTIIPRAFGVGVVLPSATLMAFQNKQNTKLLASTQIHAFNNKDSSARIGQRVPVRTASFAPVGNTGGNNNNNFVGDVINYEQVGLTLKFKPIVFPNQDVQVEMEIESKDVVAGGTQDNPVFSERTIKGVARVQNNKTLLLASVAQDVSSNGRAGLPFLGLIPILGRLFTAPTRDDRQVDIVIAITPQVIRSPAVLPEDEMELETGSMQVPTTPSLGEMLREEERDEYLASLKRIERDKVIQMPDRAEVPAYVRTGSEQTVAVGNTEQKPEEPVVQQSAPTVDIKPIDSSIRNIDVGKTSNTTQPEENVETLNLEEKPAESKPRKEVPVASIGFAGGLEEMKAGETRRVAIKIDSAAHFRSAVIGLQYDPTKLKIKNIKYGNVFGKSIEGSAAEPFLNNSGRTNISLSLPEGASESMTGELLFFDLEVLANGIPQINIDKDILNLLTSDGRTFIIN